MLYVVLAIAAVGHVVLWAAAVNRLHGLGIERRWVDAATLGCAAMMAVAPLVVAVVVWQRVGGGGATALGGDDAWTATWLYVWLCVLMLVVAVVDRLRRAMHAERRGVQLANHTRQVDLRRATTEPLTAAGVPTLLSRVPGNQLLEIHVQQKRLALPRMPAGASLRIAHLSDFHMSGRVTKPYFSEVVEQVNALQPDLVALTGDLVERSPCLDWLPDTLGRLRAPGGVYFVLGNHDRHVDASQLIGLLEEMGLQHLGGRHCQATVAGLRLVLAGNEVPWYGPAANMADAERRDAAGQPLRILLAHGPDQFAWAQQHDFDLMLAGHNHGGQVCLPGLGAILAPSRSGTRYAGGAFHRGPTVLHVSRGTGSLFPVRWNCPPEIALLELVPATTDVH